LLLLWLSDLIPEVLDVVFEFSAFQGADLAVEPSKRLSTYEPVSNCVSTDAEDVGEVIVDLVGHVLVL
jgi:hypothetical protein